MAVLIEALSVVVSNYSLNSKFPGGSRRFQDGLRDEAICFDAELTCIHLQSPDEVEGFINWCSSAGLAFMCNGSCVDMVVVDQRHGPTTRCDWIEYGHFPIQDGNRQGHVAAAWLFAGKRKGAGLHLPADGLDITMPVGWRFKGSMSESHIFVPQGK